MDILQGFVDMKLMMDKPERGNQKLLTEHYKVNEWSIAVHMCDCVAGHCACADN